jgi:hypothetical protein
MNGKNVLRAVSASGTFLMRSIREFETLCYFRALLPPTDPYYSAEIKAFSGSIWMCSFYSRRSNIFKGRKCLTFDSCAIPKRALLASNSNFVQRLQAITQITQLNLC